MTSMVGNFFGNSLMGSGGTATGSGSNKMTGGNVIPKGYKAGQLQQFTPEQMQLFQHMFGQVGPESYLGKLAGGDESMFQQMEAPYQKMFGEQVSGIANKYSGMGAGARRSSGFQNETTQAASDFTQALRGQRMGLQRQAMQDLMGMQQMLLGMSPYQRFLIENQQKQSGWGKALGVGLPIAGAIAGGLIPGAGPMGAALGAQLGSAAASGFSGTPHKADYSGIGNLPTKWGQ